jgi:SAM-dependent methyltransferase
MDMQSTKRFSSRVSDYVKYRPGYPRELVPYLTEHHGLTKDAVVADLGSGTGLLAKPFLDSGNRVLGVEPNDEMRQAGEVFLAGYPRFTSIAGAAEATTLPDASVDWITAGQAFHWFDVPRTRLECQRILRPGGLVLLIWNLADTEGSPALRAYEAIAEEFGTEFAKVRKGWEAGEVSEFFTGGYATHALHHEQIFDLAGLRGRLLSSSYIPHPGDPRYVPMIQRLEEVFHRHAENGVFRFPYKTKLYLGHVSAGETS